MLRRLCPVSISGRVHSNILLCLFIFSLSSVLDSGISQNFTMLILDPDSTILQFCLLQVLKEVSRQSDH